MPLAEPEVIADLGALGDLEGRWRELAERGGNAFVSPEWYRAWCEVYGQGATAAVVVVRRADGSLAGLLPFAIEGARGRRRTRFGGANLGDHFHPLIADDGHGAVVRACAGALFRSGAWGTLVLDNVEADATWPRELAQAAPWRLVARGYRDAVLPRIDLAGLDSWDDYLATRSRNARSQLRRYERGLRRNHDVEFRRTESAGTLQADLDTFFRLHYARWQDRGGSSSASERVREFHARFAAAALERGWLRLWFLEVVGEPVSAWYGWSLGGRYSYYLAGFDPAWAQQRVGHVLLAHTIADAISEGASEYDMLLGDEAYKGRFATCERRVQTMLITRAHRPSGAVAAAEVGLWRLSRRLPAERRARVRELLGGALDALPGRRRR